MNVAANETRLLCVHELRWRRDWRRRDSNYAATVYVCVAVLCLCRDFAPESMMHRRRSGQPAPTRAHVRRVLSSYPFAGRYARLTGACVRLSVRVCIMDGALVALRKFCCSCFVSDQRKIRRRFVCACRLRRMRAVSVANDDTCTQMCARIEGFAGAPFVCVFVRRDRRPRAFQLATSERSGLSGC